jgi:hypothetical protein
MPILLLRNILATTGSYNPVITTNLAVDGNFVVPAGLLAYIRIINAAGLAALNIGTTPGGTQLLNGQNIVAGVASVFNIGEHLQAATTLYITGVTSATTIDVIKF